MSLYTEKRYTVGRIDRVRFFFFLFWISTNKFLTSREIATVALTILLTGNTSESIISSA